MPFSSIKKGNATCFFPITAAGLDTDYSLHGSQKDLSEEQVFLQH